LNLPTGVAADTKGNVYIADSDNQRVRKVNAAGVISTIAGNGTPSYCGDAVRRNRLASATRIRSAWTGWATSTRR
jgi:NHL repeat